MNRSHYLSLGESLHQAVWKHRCVSSSLTIHRTSSSCRLKSALAWAHPPRCHTQIKPLLCCTFLEPPDFRFASSPNCTIITYLLLCLSKKSKTLNVSLSFKLSLELAGALRGKSQENLTSETGKGQAGDLWPQLGGPCLRQSSWHGLGILPLPLYPPLSLPGRTRNTPSIVSVLWAQATNNAKARTLPPLTLIYLR